MASPTAAGETRAARGRWQVSLADLTFMVLAAGMAVGIARGARDVWGMRASASTGTVPVPFSRTVGLAVEIAAIWLAMILARGVLAIVRDRRRTVGAPTQTPRLWAMAWRAAAIVLVLSLAMREAWVLRIDFATFDDRLSPQAGWRAWYQVREMLIPVCSILAVIGLALGAGAGLAIMGSDPRRSRPYWLFVPLAAIAAILFMGLPNGWWGLITQLVLLALEAVNNAMRPADRMSDGSLSERLLRAGIETIPAAIACLGLALVVARDFDRARTSKPWATTRLGRLLRMLALAAALAGGAVVGLIAMPTVSPHWLYGLGQVLEPEIIGMVLAGFGVFSAGLAARALSPSMSHAAPHRATRLARIAVPVGLLTIILLSALESLPSSTQLDPAVPGIVGRVCDLIREIPAWIWSLVPDSGEISFAAWFEPERLAWMLATAAVVLFVLELGLSRGTRDARGPFDAVAESPGQLGRFLWLTTALTTTCLVAMPTLAVLGQVIVHIRFHIDRWMVEGWPSPF